MVEAICAIRPYLISATEFQFGQTADERMLKTIRVIDEFTCEALACDVELSIDADWADRCFDRLTASRGIPVYVRFGTSPS